MQTRTLFGITALTLAMMGDARRAYAAIDECELDPDGEEPAEKALQVAPSHADATRFKVKVGSSPWQRVAKDAKFPVSASATVQVVGFKEDGTVVCHTPEAKYTIANGGSGRRGGSAAPSGPSLDRLSRATVGTETRQVLVREKCEGGFERIGRGTLRCKNAIVETYDPVAVDGRLIGATENLTDTVTALDLRVDGLEATVARIPRPPVEGEQSSSFTLGGYALGAGGYGTTVGGFAMGRFNLADALPYLVIRGRLGSLGLDRLSGGAAIGSGFQLSQYDTVDVSVLGGWDGDDRGETVGDHAYAQALLRWRPQADVALLVGINGGAASFEKLDDVGEVEEDWRFAMGAEVGAGVAF